MRGWFNSAALFNPIRTCLVVTFIYVSRPELHHVAQRIHLEIGALVSAINYGARYSFKKVGRANERRAF